MRITRNNPRLSLSLALVLVLVLIVSVPRSVDSQNWRDFVHKDIQDCCQEVATCSINAAVYNNDGSLTLFYNHLFIDVSRVRPNNYPVLRKDSVQSIATQWGELQTVDRYVPIVYALSVGDLTLLRHNQGWYAFKKRVQQGQRTEKCDSSLFKGGFCEQRISSAASFSRGPGKEPWIVLYVENGLKYRLKAFPGNVKTHTIEQNMLTGYIYAITALKREDARKQEVVVEFNRNRMACFSHRSYDETRFDFANTNTDASQPECWLQSTFLGCPQSFCLRNDVDDAFRGEAKEHIVFFRGPYGWQQDDKPLPLDTPAIDRALVLGSTHSLRNYIPYIDAADIVFTNSDRFVYLFKDTKVLTIAIKRSTNVEDVKPLTELAKVFPGMGSLPFLDGSWFNRKTKQMFLFHETAFWVFAPNFASDSISWSLVGGKRFIGDELRGVCESIDGALSLDDNVYLFKEQWYYPIHEGTWNNAQGPLYQPKVMFGDNNEDGFFATRKDCRFPPDTIPRKRVQLKPFTPKAARKGEARPPPPPPPPPPPTGGEGKTGSRGSSDASDTDSGRPFSWWILVLLLVILLVVAAAGIFAFVVVSRKKKVKPDPPPKYLSKSISKSQMSDPMSTKSFSVGAMKSNTRNETSVSLSDDYDKRSMFIPLSKLPPPKAPSKFQSKVHSKASPKSRSVSRTGKK